MPGVAVTHNAHEAPAAVVLPDEFVVEPAVVLPLAPEPTQPEPAPPTEEKR